MTAVVAFLKLAGSSIWRFLSSLSLWQAIALGLAVFALVQHFQLASARSDAARWHKQFTAEHQAREADRKAYIQAQKDAADLNRKEVAEKEARSKQISEETKSAYQNDLARLRADNQRLRSHAQGSAGGSGSSKDGGTSQGADGADKLPLPPEELLRAQEIELRLMYLQNWVEEQLKAQ